MPDKIEQSMLAPCGMNCKVCYVHLKTKNPCSGCQASSKNKPERCRKCTIKDCTEEKGFSYCFSCKDFPCQKIKNLEKSYIKRYEVSLIKNSKVAREKGIEYFMENDKIQWTCSNCNGIISLHDRICSECKEPNY